MLSSDPTLERIEQERRARNSVVRNTVMWMPLFIISFGCLLFFSFDVFFNSGDHGGTVFLLIVLSILSFLFGYQGIHALLDLIHGDTTMEGIVTRRWSRTDSLVIKSHYIRINNQQIFRIDNYYHGDAKAGDIVRIRYYPRSAIVIELEKLKLDDDEEAPAQLEAGKNW
jgi:hypothetical protein